VALTRGRVRLDMGVLRWVFLALYSAVLVGLFGLAHADLLPGWDWLDPFEELEGKLFLTIFILFVTVISQLVFVCASGSLDICRPVGRPRIILPAVMAAVLMSCLVVGLVLALEELIGGMAAITDNDMVLLSFMGVMWVVWTVLFVWRYSSSTRYIALRNLTRVMLVGSLFELMVTFPSHMWVTRRGGCFLGIGTGVGVSAGLMVMLWAFGPAMLLLFLRGGRGRKLQGG